MAGLWLIPDGHFKPGDKFPPDCLIADTCRNPFYQQPDECHGGELKAPEANGLKNLQNRGLP